MVVGNIFSTERSVAESGGEYVEYVLLKKDFLVQS